MILSKIPLPKNEAFMYREFNNRFFFIHVKQRILEILKKQRSKILRESTDPRKFIEKTSLKRWLRREF